MEPQQYLEERLKRCAHYELSLRDQEILKRTGIKNFIFEQITRKKFRRWKLPDAAQLRINDTLDYCLSEQKPIFFRFRFGGYKLWRLQSQPEVDWAEFFALAHYSEYLAPVIAIYKPGVRLLFMSGSDFVERLDNVPKSDTEAYKNSFQMLCEQFEKFAPQNFSIQIKQSSSLYNSTNELNREFEAKMEEMEGMWRENGSAERMRHLLIKSTLNIKWDGVRDLTRLSDEEKQKVIERGVIMHDAIIQLPTINAFYDNTPGMIFLFSTPFPNVVSVGTTRTSVVKFWVGTGVLEERGGKYLDHVLSPSQVEKLREIPFQEIPIDLIMLKNFSEIRIYNQKLSFRFVDKGC